MWKKVQETVSFLQRKGFVNPDYAIVLGSGLGDVVSTMDIICELPYTDIPNFSVATVQGHLGRLVYGKLGAKNIIILQGRFHYYEGWTINEVTFPIRVFKFLGIENMIVTNASGGVNPNFNVGDLMLIKDHINMMPVHPLRGKNDSRFGPRFVDMHEPYDLQQISRMEALANKHAILMHKGVYLGLQGPTFETPSEYKMIRTLGADAVGMSTVSEVIVAKHLNMKCLGISVITDLGSVENPKPVSHEAVQKAAKNAGEKLSILLKEFVQS